MTFCCGYCPARFGGFTDLVTHYEGRHVQRQKQAAPVPYMPKAVAGLSAYEAGRALRM